MALQMHPVSPLRERLDRLVLFGCLIAAVAAVDPVKPCDLARDWAKANIGRLPTTLDEFRKYDQGWQVAIFNFIEPRDRVALWHEHYAEVLATENGLTAEQRQFIVDHDRDLDRRLLSEDRAAMRREVKAVIEPRVRALFGKDKQRMARIFFSVDTSRAERLHPTVLTASLVPNFASGLLRAGFNKLTSPKTRSAPALSDPCNCIIDLGCPAGYICWTITPNCTPLPIGGCGLDGSVQCSYHCV